MTFINPQIVLQGKTFVQSDNPSDLYNYVWFLLGDPIYEGDAEGRFKNPNTEGDKEEILKFDNGKLKFRADSVAAFCAAANGTGLSFEGGENAGQEDLPTLKYIFKNTEAAEQHITFRSDGENYGFELNNAGHLVLAKLKDGKQISDVDDAVGSFFNESGGKIIDIGKDTEYSLFAQDSSGVIKDIMLAYGGLTGGLKVNNYNYSGFNVGSSTITISGFVN